MNTITNLLESGESFTTCFEFFLATKEKLFLTSSNKSIEVNGKNYLPYSGLNLESFEFNDSSHNHIKLSGIFETKGINNSHILDKSEIGIFFYFPNKKLIFEWVTYHFGKIEHDGLKFVIILNSEIFKLHKTLLQNYSRNCRAAFGDSKCKIDPSVYSICYDVTEVNDSEIKIAGMLKPDGFFTNGKANFDDGLIYHINDHKGSSIILSKALYCDIKKHKRVILTPGCDKNITTCCNKYGNAINFRGEPYIP